MQANDPDNPILGGNNTGLIIRMDYPGIETIDKVKGFSEGKVDVTGSIVFVSDHSVFANHLWDIADADVTGKQQCDTVYYDGSACWADLLSSGEGDASWNGNSDYFITLIRDMMEHDNDGMALTVTRENSNFYVVFDESRHVTSALTSPFTEAMGAIVMLTSDTLLKWLDCTKFDGSSINCNNGGSREGKLETCIRFDKIQRKTKQSRPEFT